MPEVKDLKNKDGGSEMGDEIAKWAFIALAVAAAVFVAAGPTLVAFAIFWLLRRRLAHRDFWIVLVTGLLAAIVSFRRSSYEYSSWLASVLPGGDGVGFPPLWAVLTLAWPLAGVIGLVGTSRFGPVVATKLPWKSSFDPDQITPSRAEIDKLKVVSPTIDELVISSESHSENTESHSRAIPVGRNPRTGLVTMAEKEFETHGVVLGATGSGKTITLQTMIAGLLDVGWHVVVLDLKEDTKKGGLRDFCRDYSLAHTLRFQELTLSSERPAFWFNPLHEMTADEMLSTMLSMQTFDDGYWQAINKAMLGQLVQLCYYAWKAAPDEFDRPDMYAIGKILKSGNLANATKRMIAVVTETIPSLDKEDFGSLINPAQAEAQSADGLGSRIVHMYNSDVGKRALRPMSPDQLPLDVTSDGVSYIGLNTLGVPELSSVVSMSVLMRLSALAGQRTTGQTEVGEQRMAIVIDEANWIDRKSVMNLLSRARSAKIAVILATQGPQDWNDANGEDWDAITQNTNFSIVMRQGNERSAEMCADLLGKRKVSTLLQQVRDGDLTESGSVKESVEHVVSTIELRDLQVGEGYLKVGVPRQRCEFTVFNMREPLTHARSGTQGPRRAVRPW